MRLPAPARGAPLNSRGRPGGSWWNEVGGRLATQALRLLRLPTMDGWARQHAEPVADPADLAAEIWDSDAGLVAFLAGLTAVRDVVIDTDIASLLQKHQAPPWVLRQLAGAGIWMTFVTRASWRSGPSCAGAASSGAATSMPGRRGRR